MPALPPVPGVLRMYAYFTVGVDANALNRYHIAYSGTAPTDAVCVTLAHDIWTEMSGGWVGLMAVNTNLTGVSLEDLTSPTSGSGEYLAVAAGTRGGGPLPAGAAVLSNAKIGRRYRGGKPRAYLVLGAGGDLTDRNDWDGTVTGSADTLMNGLAAYINGLTESGTILGSMVSVSYYEGFTPYLEPSGRYRNIPKLRVGGPVVDPITNWQAKTRIASQRRRNLQRS